MTMEKKFHVFDIEWDVDNQEDLNELPKDLEIIVTDKDVDNFENWWEVAEFIGNQLSDKYGFCHYCFQFDEMYHKEG